MTTGTARKGKKKVALHGASSAVSAHDPTCFVISPFGGWFDSYYESVFLPAIEKAGLHACRADDLYRPSSIIHDIWAYVKAAGVLLADLTGKNPNVLYELGLAHAVGKPVIMVTQSLDDVPFDLRNLRVITYDLRDPAWGDDLSRRIEHALKEVLSAPQLAVPPAFLHVTQESSAPKVSPIEKQLLELAQEVDSLRRSHLNRSVLPEELNASDARLLIEQYLKTGMPTAIVRDRLIRRGVPRAWLDEEIRKAREKREIERSENVATQSDDPTSAE